MHPNNQEKNNDLILINAIQQGDKTAFNLLIHKYHHRILKLINRYVKNCDDSFDLGQEIFMKAYQAIGKFRKESAFFTWLYKIAINTIKSYLMDQKNYRSYSCDFTLNDNLPMDSTNTTLTRDYISPDQLLLCKELRNVFVEEISQLPKDLKIAILLREVNECTYEEIAYIMECPVGTVRSRIFRAREAIGKNLDNNKYH